MQLEELPVDLVEAICGYLAGFDAFQLSHTNSWWFALLSDGLVWHERMVHGPVPGSQQHLLHTWKRRYMQARSMLFHGLGTDDKDELLRASYACVEYPPPTDWGQFRRMYFALRTMHEESFSFDLWFALLPTTQNEFETTRYTGGVIFGLQSEERDSRNWPQYHQQFVMVDSKSNLYCSVLDVKRPVAKDLKCDHWYHLVLTYDLEHQKQDVYLDGDNVWSTTGALHREWQHLLHEQVGTGYITAGGGDYPHGDFVGWYGFHGLLDEFRFYSGVLPLEEVQHLAQGGDLSPKRPTRGDRRRRPEGVVSTTKAVSPTSGAVRVKLHGSVILANQMTETQPLMRSASLPRSAIDPPLPSVKSARLRGNPIWLCVAAQHCCCSSGSRDTPLLRQPAFGCA
ncbi:hypothetical protein PC116_g28111 [Phytophthora cactorum]|uniref:F-box domain-containing protein n=1 Tax=Phytophthora cactorum TaxID=29920 RepID=A0A8T0XV69_9STRA|nr:hypothetical protein PC111_g23443 [Phytophthora cactorum]KAG2792839.1 hypothetical protein PC112_g23697 [Phytophthora cactorum]KAG2812590.1 hypothetical protein PC113_g23541 [Phytophthora cactorum]KAG2958137.1 hypothetical protein PC118_g23676 [Phytophthora cactorum]KAG2961571.1 hypothetical protein PC119_g26069 [Phytophthora cactorum]